MEKEYGKLTADQFKELIGKLPALNRQRNDFGKLLTEVPKAKFDAVMTDGFSWGEIYESSFPENIAIAIVAFGQLQ